MSGGVKDTGQNSSSTLESGSPPRTGVLADDLINTIKDKLSVMGRVTLKEKRDEKLLGGFIIKIGDLQYDSSVKKQINNVKRAFKL